MSRHSTAQRLFDVPKHRRGRPTGSPATRLILPDADIPGLPRCPHCKSHDTAVATLYRYKQTQLRIHKCNSCQSSFRTPIDGSRKLSKSESARRRHRAAVAKECSICQRIRPIAEFSKKANDADLYRASCNECLNDKRHLITVKDALATRGITSEEYSAILDRQKGQCAICGTSNPGRRNRRGKVRRIFSLDHCHKTGKVRGLLCNRCNLALGNFDDDVSRLESAIAYLRRNAV